MKNIILFFSVFTLILSSLFPEYELNQVPLDTNDDYKKQWQQVDSLLDIGLPKSALEIVEQIYATAKTDENNDQILKSYVYRIKLKNSFEEYAFEDLIYEMEADVKTQKFPNDAMMHSMLAEMYFMYYQANRWQIQERTTIQNFKPDDIQTWTLENMIDASIKHYSLSLKDEKELQKTSMKVYNEIINSGSKPEEYRPTLYDFLAHRAINFYRNSEITITRPADYFELKEDFYFADAKFFATRNIKSNDTLSLHYNGIKVLQKLLYFRYENRLTAPEALIDADLIRLNYVYSFSVSPKKNELYFDALKNMQKEYAGKKGYEQILYSIATFQYTQSSKYNSENEETKKYKTYKNEAHKLCEQILKDYPKTESADKALALKYQIEQHSISLNLESTVIPNKTFACRLDYRNMEKVYFKVVSIDRDKYQKIVEKDRYGYEMYDELIKASKKVYTFEKDLPKDADFNSHSTEFLMKELPTGLYIVIASNNQNFEYEENMLAYSVLQVSNISYVSQERDKGQHTVLVLNRETGEPLPNVEVTAYFEKYDYTTRRYVRKLFNTYKTDSEGMFVVKPSKRDNWISIQFEMKLGNDFFDSNSGVYLYHYGDNDYEPQPYITFFTDRAIYRPGQTVHYKGIVLKKEGLGTKIIPNRKQKVIFYDVNWQPIAETEVTSNEFGTFSGTFDIPTGLLNGNMQLYTSIGSKYIKVEEYKRPTFEVKMLPFDGNYILDDSVSVKGSALNYSGAKLTDAQVKFRIQRTPRWFGWWYYSFSSPTIEIENGTVETDENGEFEIKFKAIPDLSIKKSEYTAFNYSISVDVTDINGETQSTSKSITVGYTALKVDLDLSGQINKEQEYRKDWEVPITTQNLNGEFIAAKGDIEIFKMKDNYQPLRTRLWAKPEHYLYTEKEWKEQFAGNVYKDELSFENYEVEKSVHTAKFDTEKEKVLKAKFLKKWDSGIYMAKISSKDKFGNEVSYKRFFILYSEKDKTLPYNTVSWFQQLTPTCEPGETAKFVIGSGLENTKVLYQLVQGDKILKQEWLKLSKEQKLIEIPITEEYRGNIGATFVFVKNNRQYVYNGTVTVPFSNKDLDIEFATFRDKLYPGEKEEWQIKIKGAKGDKALAEMVGTLYDASLDQFASNSWYSSFYSYLYNGMTWSASTYDSQGSTMLSQNFNLSHYFSNKSYKSLNWFGFSYYSYGYGYYDFYELEEAEISYAVRTTSVRKEKNGRFKKNAESKTEVADTFIADDFALDGAVGGDKGDMPAVAEQSIVTGETTGGANYDNVQIRENFSETAFFYPHLRTNENGDVVVSFTMPESLTKWKFMGFAHTKDMEFGYVNKELVTQKDLMLMPNAPRFFREGDKMTFPVKINNVSETDFEGNIKLEFIDAITMKPVDNIIVKSETAEKKFAVKAGKNTLVEWQIEIPHGIGLVTYKVVATTGKFSDGEQKPIPVLTNRMLVTESMPLPIRGKTTKEFKFTKLLNSKDSKTLKHHRYTLEFTSNPAWYAVQSLPYLIEYPYECSEQTFSRYYANTLASHIANSSPKIKAVFDSWKNTPKSEALLSNLEKNQELKSVLLQETPWVLNSQDESERKRRIGLLFDLNRMADEQSRALKKLQREQKYNGGWPWFSGMPESQYITQHIVTGMGHLRKLEVINFENDYEIKQMVTKAVGFLDGELVRDYKWLKKHYTEEEMKENHLSQIAIHYFYGRSYFLDIPIDKKTQEAFDYYKGQMQKYWLSTSKYSQGMIALALHRYEDDKTPMMVINSLREHSLEDEELGMYWKDNVAGYYWYQAPIETQALMIEAFDEVADDQKSVESMKVWLLKNKQTNDWKTTKATVEAVYALLLRGMDMLADDQLCEVKIGGEKIDPKTRDDVKVEAGTGYYKVAWHGNEITPKMGNVSVTKKTEGVAWGAVYWQYFEDLDKITAHETPLKLKKQLFKEVITDRGEQIVPVEENSELKIGDKVIVRIELRVDRAMDYVHMKDMRASGFEPINVISRYKWQDGLGYYESTKDASTNFFISHLPKGTFVFEYPLRVTHTGNFSNGITTIQCMYAPEFTSHSEGVRVNVKK